MPFYAFRGCKRSQIASFTVVAPESAAKVFMIGLTITLESPLVAISALKAECGLKSKEPLALFS